MERLFDRHHAFFEKPDYKTKEERKLREHPLVVIPMYTEFHNRGRESLHANMEAPPKPDKGMILGATALLNEMAQDGIGHVEAMEHLANYFDNYKYDRGIARAIGENLIEQLVYIEPGIVRKK